MSGPPPIAFCSVLAWGHDADAAVAGLALTREDGRVRAWAFDAVARQPDAMDPHGPASGEGLDRALPVLAPDDPAEAVAAFAQAVGGCRLAARTPLLTGHRLQPLGAPQALADGLIDWMAALSPFGQARELARIWDQAGAALEAEPQNHKQAGSAIGYPPSDAYRTGLARDARRMMAAYRIAQTRAGGARSGETNR